MDFMGIMGRMGKIYLAAAKNAAGVHGKERAIRVRRGAGR